MKQFKRTSWLRSGLALLLTLAMMSGLAFSIAAESAPSGSAGLRVETRGDGNGNAVAADADSVEEALRKANEMVRVSIVLKEESTLDAGFSTVAIADNVRAMRYRETLVRQQQDVIRAIENEVLSGAKLDVVWNLTIAANVISANVRRGLIPQIEAMPQVDRVVAERQYAPAQVSSSGNVLQPNMAIAGDMNHTENVWKAGYTGAGARIAIIDTGLDLDHQSFSPEALSESVAQWEQATGKKASLMTADDVLRVLDKLNIAARGVTPEQIAEINKNAKVPFGYNYIDYSFDITHDNDSEGAHGSHVAGIAAANRLVDTDRDGQYEDALTAVKVAGNAPDAQLLIMKVFGKSGGAYDSDCAAAIEDAILLGADAVNLSLGGANPGMATPNPYYDDLMDRLQESNTVVVISSGNSGAWSDNTGVNNGNLYADGINFQTNGEPGSYKSAFTVASVENQGLISQKFTVDGKNYAYTEDTSYGNPHLATLDLTGDGTDYTFYILPESTVSEGTKPGTEEKILAALGKRAEGNIVVCWRGGTNEDGERTSMLYKAQQAEALGAVAVIIVNYENRTIIADLTGYEGNIPIVTVQHSVGVALVQASLPEGGTTADLNSGTLTVRSEVFEDVTDPNVYTMSDFSSWGVPGDLTLKPEITAPGGYIYSVNGLAPDGSSYETMSGTSMAAPQISGMAALVQQYLRDNKIQADDMTVRALTHSLLMGTAHPMRDSEGNLYPVFRQGAGLADVSAAVSTPVYITVQGQNDGKVKAELGDDIRKNGVYEVVFTLHNMTGVTQYYDLDGSVFTQLIQGGSLLQKTRTMDASIEFLVGGKALSDASLLIYDFNDDGEFNRKDAQLLLDNIIAGTELVNNADNRDVDQDGDVDTHDVHVLLTMSRTCAEVPANGSVEVKATIVLRDSEKEFLNRYHTKGAYVEAYLTASPLASDDGAIPPELNVPVLAFYGNWTDSSMFDVGSMLEHDYGIGTWREPYMGNSNIEGSAEWSSAVYNYFDVSLAIENFAYLNPYYGNPLGLDMNIDWEFQYFPERNAISANIRLENYYYALIRNAGAGVIQVTNEEGDQVYYRQELGAEEGAYYVANAGWFNTVSSKSIDWCLSDYTGDDIHEGDKIKLSLIMAPEYYAGADGTYNWDALTDGDPDNGELGTGAYLSTTFTVDLTPPEFVEPEWIYGEDYGDMLDIAVTVRDNQYVAYLITRCNDDEDGLWVDMEGPNLMWSVYMAENQTEAGQDLFADAVVYIDYLPPDKQEMFDYSGVYNLLLVDYAGNYTIYRYYHYVDPTEDPEGVEIYTVGSEYGEPVHVPVTSVSLLPDSSIRVKAAAYPITLTDRSVTWKSDDPDIATVSPDGVIVGIREGNTTIHAISTLDPSVEATIPVTVYVIPGVATGVLSDTDYMPKMFTWNFGTRTLEMGAQLPYNPLAVTAKYGTDHFYLLDVTNNLYEFNGSGEQVDGPWRWKPNGPGSLWDIADSAVGIFAVNMGYFFGPYDPDSFRSVAWPVGEAAGMPNLWMLAIASADEHWDAVVDGVDYEGDTVLYSVDTEGNVWKFYIYWSEEHNRYEPLFEMYESDLGYIGAYPEGGEPYCSLAVGDDGNLYFSFKGPNSAYLFQMHFNEGESDGEGAYYSALPLDHTPNDVWPADLISVHAGAATDGGESGGNGTHATTHATHARACTGAVDAASIRPVTVENRKEPNETADGGAGAGGTQIGPVPGVTDVAGTDLTVGTVTVPVRVTDSTNGEFVLYYDTDVLTLQEIIRSNLLTCVESDPDAGTVHAGYADENAVTETVLTLVFTYEPKINEDSTTTVTVETMEDGSESGGTPIRTDALEVTLEGQTVPEYTVSVHYVDEDGNEISEPSTESYLEGDAYTVTPPVIEGYDFVRAEGELEGTVTADTEITLVYEQQKVEPPAPTGEAGSGIAPAVFTVLLCTAGLAAMTATQRRKRDLYE